MLGQVFSDLDPNMLRDRFETCTRGDVHVSNLMEHMHEKRPQPALHAEMRLIEHTVAWGRRATMNQYIACSKPPCYCCALYARLRRYDIRMRPGHGNAYVKWALPFFQNESSFQRQQRGDQNDVLSKMIKEMRYTVQEQLIKGLHRGFYRPDSATDISTTLPSMRNPLPTGTQLEIPSHQKNSQ
nr:hypothetical protein CFP56_78518 [Quercus suber]